MLYQKILNQLKTKYANKGFSAKVLEGLATELAKTITDEANIESSVNGIEPYLTIMQGEFDRQRQAQPPQNPNPQPGNNQPDGNPTVKKDDMPDWANQMMESHKTLLAELNTLKSGNIKGSRKKALEAKLDKAPEKFKAKILKDFDRMSFDNDAQFEEFLTDTENDLAEINQEFTSKGLSIQTISGVSGNQSADSVKKDIEGWSNQAKAKVEVQSQKS